MCFMIGFYNMHDVAVRNRSDAIQNLPAEPVGLWRAMLTYDGGTDRWINVGIAMS